MDYSDYEVHETFPAACVGAEIIAVLQNGNKGLISGLKAVSGQQTMFQVRFSENGMCDVYESEVDHYLTPPKPKRLPDHPGLWKDNYGGIWLRTTDGALKLLHKYSYWCCDGSYTNLSIQNHAPFVELEVKEKEQ